MTSHAAATDIPMAHPITLPKLAAIRKSLEIDIHLMFFNKIDNTIIPSMSTIV